MVHRLFQNSRFNRPSTFEGGGGGGGWAPWGNLHVHVGI